MPKMIIIDDFNNAYCVDPDKQFLLNNIPYEKEMNKLLSNALKDIPVGKKRSGVLNGFKMDGARDWYLDIMWHCECGKSVLMNKVVVLDDDDCRCPDCAGL